MRKSADRNARAKKPGPARHAKREGRKRLGRELAAIIAMAAISVATGYVLLSRSLAGPLGAVAATLVLFALLLLFRLSANTIASVGRLGGRVSRLESALGLEEDGLEKKEDGGPKGEGTSHSSRPQRGPVRDPRREGSTTDASPALASRKSPSPGGASSERELAQGQILVGGAQLTADHHPPGSPRNPHSDGERDGEDGGGTAATSPSGGAKAGGAKGTAANRPAAPSGATARAGGAVQSAQSAPSAQSARSAQSTAKGDASAGVESSRVEPDTVDGLVRQLAKELGAIRPGELAGMAPPRTALGESPRAAVCAARKSARATPGVNVEGAAPKATAKKATAKADDAAKEAAKADILRGDQIEIAARGGHIDLNLQPILELAERKVCHFEVLAFLRTGDDALIAPREYRAEAERRNVLSLIDRALLSEATIMLHKLAQSGEAHTLFCGLSQASMSEPGFLSAFLHFMKGYKNVVKHLVLEIEEASLDGGNGQNLEELATLRRLGFRLSLARVSDPLSALERLAGLGFNFIKVDAEALAALAGAEQERTRGAAAFVAKARAQSLEVIIEGIDSDEALELALASTAHFGQGNVFAEPQPVLAAKEGRLGFGTRAA